jgi:superfamily I DNA/RNA helicase
MRMPIWHEALLAIPLEARAYYVSCLRRGEKLRATPRIHLDTIHGVKGGEADHVAVLTDMSARTFAAYGRDPDNEHRVFYVGLTRARQTLHIIEPQTANHYVL